MFRGVVAHESQQQVLVPIMGVLTCVRVYYVHQRGVYSLHSSIAGRVVRAGTSFLDLQDIAQLNDPDLQLLYHWLLPGTEAANLDRLVVRLPSQVPSTAW